MRFVCSSFRGMIERMLGSIKKLCDEVETLNEREIHYFDFALVSVKRGYLYLPHNSRKFIYNIEPLRFVSDILLF